MATREYIFETRATLRKKAWKSRFFILLCLFILLLGFYLYLLARPSTLVARATGAFIDSPPDLIAVFTGDRGRIEFSLEKFKQYPGSKVLISGVYSQNNVQVLMDSLQKKETNELNTEQTDDISSFIQLDYEAKNTVENVQMTLQYLKNNPDVNTALIVSSDYHLPRIEFLFKMLADKKIQCAFYFDGPKSHEPFIENLKYTFFEMIKFLRSLPLLIIDTEN
jgi:uncharacterized SAM-binding protein YcdF (DUF218 family)